MRLCRCISLSAPKSKSVQSVLHKCRFYTGLRLGSLALPRLTRQARGEGRFFWQNSGGKG
ncbi:hypothetical protein DRA79_08510 [Klebsiella pneumoniae]|nr:hypothetical protein DRA79_08510 [Klebsiella pneumoniae]QHP46871.1 hypothetical protein DRA87_08785 [Klebsiella pneumoniae]HBX2785854.1 hypothetical protein [Klebsiella pneumoniae]HBX2790886.1 hypothetical protein [Klebsiella pneumoniae]HBX5854645.1 hypothetical protein [Klebsiella pneumoniae]